MISKKIIHLFKCRLQQCKVVVCGHSIPVWCFLAFVILLVFQCAILYQISLFGNRTTRYEMQTKRKTITWFRLYHRILRHHTALFDWGKCEYSNCKIIFRDLLPRDGVLKLKTDAILFQGNNLYPVHVERRDVNQVFVFVAYEPPAYMHSDLYSSPAWDSIFNWTMTYRLDSDIPYRYGELVHNALNRSNINPIVLRTAKTPWGFGRSEYNKVNYTKIFIEKRKMSAWVLSHCNTSSRREAYVEKLRQYIDVETYGDCFGGKDCSHINQSKCFDSIEKDYKFYLAFENSFCQDYVTEKAYNWTLRKIVPVVRGPPGYHRHLPPGSFINTHDFNTVKDLAYYLLDVSHDEGRYTEYLTASEGFVLRSMYDQPQIAYCKLCEKLNNLDANRKSFPSISNWWNGNGVCWNATDIH